MPRTSSKNRSATAALSQESMEEALRDLSPYLLEQTIIAAAQGNDKKLRNLVKAHGIPFDRFAFLRELSQRERISKAAREAVRILAGTQEKMRKNIQETFDAEEKGWEDLLGV